MELMLEDILDFCTGKQEDGTPMAGGIRYQPSL